MNQSVLMNDDLHWNHELGCVQCTAQFMGQLITCCVTQTYLAKQGCKQTVSIEMLSFSHSITFDIEEDTQVLITNEQIDEEMRVWLR